MTVRSTRLATWRSTAGAFPTVYTVSAGQTVIVKSLYAVNRSGVAARVNMTANLGAGVIQVSIVDESLAAAFAPLYVATWIVLGATDSLAFFCDQAGVDFWASGAVLQG